VVYPIISIFIKPKQQIKAEFVLALLRFLSLFGIILLLINPIITRNTQIIKPSLAIVVDNSSSITALDASKKSFRSI
jgi:hypothetical protein